MITIHNLRILKIILLLFLFTGSISVAQEEGLINTINNSTVKIELFWAGSKDRSSYMIEESNSLGILISGEGHVLTCYHTIALSESTSEGNEIPQGKIADTINLEFFCYGEKETLPGKVIAVDEWMDLAIIKPCEKIRFNPDIKISSFIGPFNKGEIFYSSVNPLNPWSSISSGTLAYTVLNDGGRSVMGFNMNIKSGSSGSGLFDSYGKLIGMIYATGTIENITTETDLTLVIPANSLLIFLERNNIYFNSN